MTAAQTATARRTQLLLIEDDPGVRFGLHRFLETRGLDVREAESCAEGLRAMQSRRPDAIVMDFMLPDGDAFSILPQIRALAPDAAVIVLTGHGTIELAVQAMQAGADHFLTKPVEMSVLQMVLERALERHRYERRGRADRRTRERRLVDPFLGRSALIRQLEADAHRALDTDAPVMVLGPTGSGKGVLANWIHLHGPRAEEPFVDINCAALSRELLETELFGHTKGAFTSAHADKSGLFEIANHGTVFLDELGDMDLAIQPKLLKVLEESRFRRLGEVQDRSVDVRLITATHRDLYALSRNGHFRQDLYFRISTLPLRMPSLQERAEDIPMLARTILESLHLESGRPGVVLGDEAIAALQRYPWPGNVRELRNVLERALLLSDTTTLTPADLRFEEGARAPSADDDYAESPTLEAMERRHIVRVLGESKGRVEDAARRLGIPRSSLYQKIRRFGITTTR